MDRYAVIGHPVAHSLSPSIHQAFADQTGIALAYERIEAPLDAFRETVSKFFGDGGRGCNVTVPFKGEAADWVDELDSEAEFAAAVNTIVPIEGGRFTGYNTDGAGLVIDLSRLLGNATGLRVLLLGAGGAVRGVVRPLLQSLAGELVIVNRTAGKAVDLAGHLGGSGKRVLGGGYELLADPGVTGRGFDLVVNGTSAGLQAEVPPIPPSAVDGAFCYDMVYGAETAFCRWALGNGARAAEDGLGMLVEQAALAFRLWRGVLPQTGPVRDALKRKLVSG
jgi:shikimate dehydrogenase